MLTTIDHRRDSAGLLYVYPVISRRAGGVSVGINLNTNNACNWACVYCQVENLTRGGPPPIDLDRLESELKGFLNDALNGDFMQRQVPPEARQLMDIAFSGNGEPTSAPEFADAVERVASVLESFGLRGKLMVRLITNGSLMHRPVVQQGIALIGQQNGEIWFKVDHASEAGSKKINGIGRSAEQTRAALLLCAQHAPTWVQTCFFSIDGQDADEPECRAYLDFIASVRTQIHGVYLYGLARPSMQPDAKRLSAFPHDSLQIFAQRISSLGVKVIMTP